MPRPKKTNIDYFPLYCCYDERIALAEAEQGIEAFYIYIKLLMRIYGGKGYYLEWDNKKEILFSNENHIEADKVHQVVEALIMYDLFSREIYDNYGILTSKEIQEHYLYAVSRRKIDQLDQRLVLVNVTETKVNVTETQVNVTETRVNVAESTQIKENKRKENKTIEKESVFEAPAPKGQMNNVILTEEEYGALKSKYTDIDNTIDRLSVYMASTGKSYPSHYATLIRWAEEDICRQSIAPIYSSYPSKATTNTKAAVPKRESSFDIDEFYEFACKQDIRACLT
ncbi:MAG: DUF4373 domain-containing protein [Clostridia bacterium]|nr:DUF4373 domain-containing protein [Clostridia bacterium]